MLGEVFSTSSQLSSFCGHGDEAAVESTARFADSAFQKLERCPGFSTKFTHIYEYGVGRFVGGEPRYNLLDSFKGRNYR